MKLQEDLYLPLSFCPRDAKELLPELEAMKNKIDEIMAHVLEPDEDIETGMEKAAKDSGLLTLDDIEVIDYAQHPLVEITTKLVKREDLK